MTRAINLIVVHCSATPSGKAISATAAGKSHDAAWVINSWHAARGFRRQKADLDKFNPQLTAIGYHYVVDLDGSLLPGRGLDEVPAQAAGFNANAIGICMVGGMEPQGGRYTRAQWESLATLVRSLCDAYHVPLAAPSRTRSSDLANHPLGYTVQNGVCGHRDLSPDRNGNGLIERFEWIKTCPGFDVQAWMANGLQPLSPQLLEGAP